MHPKQQANQRAIGRRTVLTYLLGMVVPIAREAMREP
jgi:hypothetical protein